MKEALIIKVMLAVDKMTNKGEVPKTNISHFTVPSAALWFSFL